MSLRIEKKLSVATVSKSVKPKDFKDIPEGKELHVMRIAGIVRAVNTGETKFGPYLEFSGDFRAIDVVSGEEVVGPKMFLPSPLDAVLRNEFLAVAVDQETGEIKKGAQVSFAYDISVISDPKSSVGYVYQRRSLMNTEEAQPVRQLLASLPPLTRPEPAALPAPTEGDASLPASTEGATEVPAKPEKAPSKK